MRRDIRKGKIKTVVYILLLLACILFVIREAFIG